MQGWLGHNLCISSRSTDPWDTQEDENISAIDFVLKTLDQLEMDTAPHFPSNKSESGSRVPQLPFNWQLLPAS